MTSSVLVSDFLEDLEFRKKASWHTIRNYTHYLKRFLDFAGDIDPKQIDEALVKKYRRHLTSFKKVTQNYFLIALRVFLRYLVHQNIVSLSPEKVELGKQEPPLSKVLNETQLTQLLQAPDTGKKIGIRDRAILETLFSSGLRVSEFAALNKDTSIAGEWLEKYLLLRKDTFKPLFIRFQGKVDPAIGGERMRLSPRSIQRVVEKYVKQAGLPVKATPHTLRSAR